MNILNKLSIIGLAVVFVVLNSCGSDDGDSPPQTPEQIQTAKLLGRWEPGTVIQEIDGDITDDRFSDFSITFTADAQGENKRYSIVNTGGEAFEAGEKEWDYIDGNLNRIERIDNGFEFDISLTNNDTELANYLDCRCIG